MENQNNNEEKKKAIRKTAGQLFVGCMFIGMALGWYFKAFNIGMFGGMGIGFIMSAVVYASMSSNK